MKMKGNLHISKHIGGIMASWHEPEGMRSLSDFYWRCILFLAFCAVSIFLVYGIWGLLRILDGLDSSVQVSTLPSPALNRGSIDITVEGFEKRRELFDSLKTNSGKGIPDPSV